MKQNEKNNQKAQELTKEELENVNGGGGSHGKKRFEKWHMRDFLCIVRTSQTSK